MVGVEEDRVFVGLERAHSSVMKGNDEYMDLNASKLFD